jgi:hypothetical protein
MVSCPAARTGLNKEIENWKGNNKNERGSAESTRACPTLSSALSNPSATEQKKRIVLEELFQRKYGRLGTFRSGLIRGFFDPYPTDSEAHWNLRVTAISASP